VFAQTWPADRIESGALILFNLSMSLAVIAGCTAAHRQPVAAAKYFISSGIRARGGRLPISLMDGLGASRAGPLQRQMRALTEPDLRSTVC
jgi:hypothetical protein